MKIAIFDSGFGGLSVLNVALKRLPNERFIYYADCKNVPYGIKTHEQILGFMNEAFEFFLKHDVKAVVIACNTATSVAVSVLRAKFSLPIIGMEPAVKKAVDSLKTDQNHTVCELNLNPNSIARRTLVIATPVTVAGRKLKDLIKRIEADEFVDLLALPRLVEFAEQEEFKNEAVSEYLRNELGRFDLRKYGSLVLGCTHFNYFKDTLREILPSCMTIIDGNEGTINKLISELGRLNLTEKNTQDIEIYYSGERVKDKIELAKIARYMQRLDAMMQIG